MRWRRCSEARCSSFLFQVRLQKTFRHLLNARVGVRPQPSRPRQIKLQIAMFDRPVLSFTNVAKKKNASGNSHGISRLGTDRRALRGGNGESHRIPNALRRRPTATAGVAQVAERFQHVFWRKFAFMAGSRAGTTPSAAQRKPRGMRPGTVFQSRHRHEVRTGQSTLLAQGICWVLIFAGSGNCNQLQGLWPVFTGVGYAPNCRM